MYIRFSKEEDKNKIEELLDECFGTRTENLLSNLKGRYLLAFDDDKLIAMTGFFWCDNYRGYEIDWTCTKPEYRGRGIMHELFSRICALTDEDIYCSCWRLGTKDEVNLHSLMNDFGFKEVVRNRVTWCSGYNCFNGVDCKGHKKHCERCECYEDLYLRKGKERGNEDDYNYRTYSKR